MKILHLIIIAFIFGLISCNQNTALKTATFKVWGNCEKCKKTIEASITSSGVKEKNQSLKWRSLVCVANLLKSLLFWDSLKLTDKGTTALEKKEISQTNLAMESPGIDDTTPTEISVKDTDETEALKFESAKNLKAVLREGVELFNWKYKKGISYLISHKIITNDPSSIAKFLVNTSTLNKKEIGEYLGEGDPFCISVMHNFVEQLDFTGLDFVPALRHFLNYFRLPGIFFIIYSLF